jgi:hypothetical protein
MNDDRRPDGGDDTLVKATAGTTSWKLPKRCRSPALASFQPKANMAMPVLIKFETRSTVRYGLRGLVYLWLLDDRVLCGTIPSMTKEIQLWTPEPSPAR